MLGPNPGHRLLQIQGFEFTSVYTARDSKIGFGFAGIPAFGPPSIEPGVSQVLLRDQLMLGPNPGHRLLQIPIFESLPV